MIDKRQYASATQRNRQPILEVLLQVLPPQGNILEIASGTGEHAAFFAPYFRPRLWIPSEPNSLLRESITAWREYYLIDNLMAPLPLDARQADWAIAQEYEPISSIVNINMIHISPWEACLGLMEKAGKILPSGGILYLYGPYKQGEKTAPSNLAFDQSLRAQNPQWGVRKLEDVIAAGEERGLQWRETIAMPANNLSLVFERR